jgi:eukaryotic-like serine/threonine-protein kinase
VPAVINWTIQACAGLEAAHRAAVIHRDIKPQNIFLSVDGVVKVMDFGIARRATSTITANGDKSIVGTPMYLSPEHLADHPNVDHRTDIYSLGVTMYHLLTDTLPWDTTDLASVFLSILHSEVAAPSSINDNVTPALDAIVMRAMNRDVAERFADCGEMQAALRDLEQSYK